LLLMILSRLRQVATSRRRPGPPSPATFSEQQQLALRNRQYGCKRPAAEACR
jgi:hypothetical protein